MCKNGGGNCISGVWTLDCDNFSLHEMVRSPREATKTGVTELEIGRPHEVILVVLHESEFEGHPSWIWSSLMESFVQQLISVL